MHLAQADGTRLVSRSTADFLVSAPGEPKQWFRILQTLCAKSDLTISFGQDLEEDGHRLEPRSSLERDESPFSRFEKARPSVAFARGQPREEDPLVPLLISSKESGSSPNAAAAGP